MVSFRKLSNGFLIAPQRGLPPNPPEGYENVHGEDFVFAPILPDCEGRERRTFKRGCCGAVEKFYCQKNQTYVSRYKCEGCKDA